jgi:hypothetical protein
MVKTLLSEAVLGGTSTESGTKLHAAPVGSPLTQPITGGPVNKPPLNITKSPASMKPAAVRVTVFIPEAPATTSTFPEFETVQLLGSPGPQISKPAPTGLIAAKAPTTKIRPRRNVNFALLKPVHQKQPALSIYVYKTCHKPPPVKTPTRDIISS